MRKWMCLVLALILALSLAACGGEDAPENGTVETQQTTVTEAADTLTKGQRDALEAAEDYLEFRPFSYTGLQAQLVWDGHTQEDAKVAVELCGADWEQQAVLAAEEYMTYAGVSRTGLEELLLWDGFTQEQAAAAVESMTEADWTAQAALRAEYLLFDNGEMTLEEVAEELAYEGFTQEQIQAALNEIEE